MEMVVDQFQRGDLSPIIEIAGLKRQGDGAPFDPWPFAHRMIAYNVSGGSTDMRRYRR
jgi:hypothetical protein